MAETGLRPFQPGERKARLSLASAALALLVCLAAGPAPFGAHAAPGAQESYACRPQACSSLLPARPVDDPATDDCGYRRGNQWWLDYVAGTLAWDRDGDAAPVVVALFDDGADIAHVELRNQLWVNTAEARGIAGVDDDGNGYVDDVHGWDFVDDDPDVAPRGECRDRVSHGTFMASLIAAERDNGHGIAAAGADGARLMILRIVGCGRGNADRLDPQRMRRALEYATRMGARILSFSAHWHASTPELDAAFREIVDGASAHAALVVASVPNKGGAAAGYPAAYPFRRIVRAVPIGDRDMISPGTSPTLPGLNLGVPSACVLGATAAPDEYGIRHGSSNSTAILAGLLAGIWSREPYAKLSPDDFLAQVVRERMMNTPRRSQPGVRLPFRDGVPLADACTLAAPQRTAQICQRTSNPPSTR